MRESSHSFPGLNRACVVISSQLYDRRAIDSPLPTLPLLTSLQHLAYLTSTSPRIREILTVDGGLERLISIVGGCLDLAFPSAGSGSGSNPRKRTRTPQHSSSAPAKRRLVPFKPFVAYANGNIEAAQDWIDTSAVLHTYGFALQCLVNVGVRGSEEIRTRVVEAGVLAVVARILSAFLANRQKERERRLALLEPQKSITLWQEGPEREEEQQASTSRQSGAVHSSHRSSHHAQHRQQASHTPPHSAPAATVHLQHQHQQSQAQQYSQHAQRHSQQHVPAQPPTLPPSASRLPSRLLPSSTSSASSSAASLLLLQGPSSINRTNTPDTVVSIDEIDADESSGQENEMYETDPGQMMDIEDVDETGSATSAGEAIAAPGSGSSRNRRGTITSATFVVEEDMVVKLEDAAARSTTNEEQDMTASSMETPVARSISLQPTLVNLPQQQQGQQQQQDNDGDVVMSQQQQQHHPTLAQLHAASFAGSPDDSAAFLNNGGYPAATTTIAAGTAAGQAMHAWNANHRVTTTGPIPAPTANAAAPILPFMRPAAPDNAAAAAAASRATASMMSESTPQTVRQAPPPPLSPPLSYLFKEDDVLHCLHLLAYLSKYPHVRAVFHDPENETVRLPDVHPCDVESSSSRNAAAPATLDHEEEEEEEETAASGSSGRRPAAAAIAGGETTTAGSRATCPRKKQRCGENGEACSTTCARMYDEHQQQRGGPSSSSSRQQQLERRSQDGDDERMMEDLTPTAAGSSTSHSHSHSYRHRRRADTHGSDDDDDDCDDHEHGHGQVHHCSSSRAQAEAEAAHVRALASIPLKDRKPALEPSRPPRSTANNVFSLVEQFTYRPSGPADRAMRLPTDIQYWGGVIMRNACRKDEQHGGIRQCANMGCGVWEKFPREFAKCRRCRKAKYCSKGCQRRAWQAGHRYWCSARQDAPPVQPTSTVGQPGLPTADNVAVQIANNANGQTMEGEGDVTQIRVMEEL